MAVTNFESTISARAVGTQDVQAQADAMRKLAESINGLADSTKKVNDTPGFSAFAEKVKAGIQNPLQTAGDVISGFLTKLGPIGAALAGTAGIFATAGVAGMAFARSLGQMADEISDTSSRMGLTIKETNEFRFAMKYAGGEMATLEGITRKLSQEIDDGGENLKAMGVDFRDAMTGGVRPMSEIVLALSQRLNAMPDVSARNAAAIKVMGRSALAVLPDLLELGEGVARAKQLGLGPSEADIDRWNDYQKKMAEVDARWDAMVRKLKDGIAVPVMFFVGGSMKNSQGSDTLHGFVSQSFIENMNAGMGDERARMGPWQSESISRHRAELAAIKENDAAVAAALGYNDEEMLTKAKKKLEEDLKSLKTGVLPEVNAATLKKIETDRADIAGIEAKIKSTKDLEAAMKSLASWEEQMAEKEMDPISKIFFERDKQANATQQYGRATDAALPAALRELSKMRAEDDKRTFEMSLKAGKTAAEAWDELYKNVDKVSGQTVKDFLEWSKAVDQVSREIKNIEVGSERSEITARSGKTLSMMQLAFGPGQEGAAIAASYAERKRLAAELYDFEESHAQTRVDQVRAESDYHRAMYEADIEAELKLAELQRRRIEDFRSEMGSLFDALLGGKSGLQQFATGQLRTLGRAAFSNIATSVFKTGDKLNGGSIFGGTWLGDALGGNNPLKASTDANTLATMQNTAALRSLSMSPSGGGGGLMASASGTFARIAGGGFGGGSVEYSEDGVPIGNGLPTDGHPLNAWGWQRTAGVIGAGAGAGFGIYSGIRQGGGAGALMAGGSALAGAGAIISLASKQLASVAGPAGALAGLVLGSILPSLLPNHRQERAEALDRERMARAYSGGTGAEYSVDIYGRSMDYDYRGTPRSVTNVYISANDTESIKAHFERNADAIVTTVAGRIVDGNAEELVGHIGRRLGYKG